ncbi:MAG TPA: hypothetical protein VHB02_17435 [Acidimicrobiales bacterium]|nr:hypothetical protein [Acidimicrobiales bacterium]
MADRFTRSRRWTLPLALGLSDGILNALVLASSRLLHGGRSPTVVFSLKVGCVAFVTALFTMFVAEYADQRAQLARSTRQLSLSGSGHLATTKLRGRAMRKAFQAAGVASAFSFVGATLPLALAAVLSGTPWAGFVVAIVLLAALGAALAASFDARVAYWAAALFVAGLAVAAIGSWLDIA